MSKVSIIVAIYNIEQYLSRCIDSIMAQTLRDIEIILVDDGSTDKSGALCEEYALRDRRIRVIHKENGGLSDARNAGLAIAGGDYIGYVDGDDWIDPEMYQAMYEACVSTGAQMAVCRYKQVTADGIIDEAKDENVLFSADEALNLYLSGDERYMIYNSVWSKLFSRELVQGELFPVGKKSEDIMYTTKAFCKADTVAYLDHAYYNYVLDRKGSIMNQGVGERRLGDEIPFWEQQIEYLAEVKGMEIADKAAYYYYRRLLFYYIDFMQQKSLRSYAKQIAAIIKSQKNRIKRVYKGPWAKKGDAVRMKVMLLSPSLYYGLVVGYETFIIPIKSQNRMEK